MTSPTGTPSKAPASKCSTPPGGETLLRGQWVVISIDDDRATFAALADGSFGVAGVERRGDKWIFAGEASGRPCEPAVPLPAGLASTGALLAHLGDLSEPLYDIEVAERGFGYERWRIAVDDSDGVIHLGIVQAGRTAAGLWRIEQAWWCLTDAGHSDTVRQNLMRAHEELQPPADFSDCPLMSVGTYEVPEPLEEGLPTSGAVLREDLSPLPTASYTIRVAESTDRRVRWEITMTGAPWGLTFGKKIAIEDNGWRMRTDEWCHMEPERL